MTATLWLLTMQGALGAFDTVYFHEWRARLPARRAMRSELALHAVRSVIYGAVFCTLPWVTWSGPAGVLLAGLLVSEAVITFADFVVEDRVRTSLGGVFAGERVMHGLMAIVYGAFMAGFLPVLSGWITGDGTRLGAGSPPFLLAGLTALGVGSFLSGLRDAVAASGVRPGAWPWRQPDPRRQLSGEQSKPARASLPLLLGAVVLVAVLTRRSRP
jgi:hypothetical protein